MCVYIEVLKVSWSYAFLCLVRQTQLKKVLIEYCMMILGSYARGGDSLPLPACILLYIVATAPVSLVGYGIGVCVCLLVGFGYLFVYCKLALCNNDVMVST